MRSKPSPQHPSSSTHFSALPREIVIYVLQLLILDDPISIENFSGCCLAFYRLSRDNSIWKTAYQQSMARMSSQNQTTLFREAAQMESRPLSPADYRQLFLEVARLRFDGAYISQCHYIRQGLSDGSFSQPIHMVTYYRYLRFYADGTALHMLSNHEPALVIYRLRKQSMVSRRGGSGTFKDFRILVGRFQFDGTMRAISITTSDTISGKDQFHLELELRSTHLGGWNKLKWARYYSTRDGEPDHTEYSLRNFRPFMFSRVKSFLHDNVS
jgi:F-box protein 9